MYDLVGICGGHSALHGARPVALVGVQNSARQHGDAQWARLGTATFRFEGDDSLSVCGVIRYEADQVHSTTGMRHVRAVIGGTGQFIGARGEAISVHDAESTFTHTLTLLRSSSSAGGHRARERQSLARCRTPLARIGAGTVVSDPASNC